MAWVENTLNLTNGYYKVTGGEGDQFEYLVPFPPGYTSTMKAHWTTDVIVLDPSCSWQTATTGPVNSTWNVTLPQSNLGVTLWNDSLGMFLLSSNVFMCNSYAYLISVSSDAKSIAHVSVFQGYNTSATEFYIPVDGSILFVIDQFYDPESPIYNPNIPVDLTSIPTLKYPTGNVLAFLLCSPRASIQTRQIWATGNGNLTLGKPQRRQGNIDFLQANYLLSMILLNFPTDSGPTSYSSQVGTDMMVRFIFGTDVPVPSQLPPAPLTNITTTYKRAVHSAMKKFLSGKIATEYVPGGYTHEQIVFTSSLGHMFISVILFAFLTFALVAAQFRKGRVSFTLVNVAAALADSDVPQKSVEMTEFKAGTGERKVLKLVPGGDGRVYCVYESID
jgi:hypothetical protein